MSGISFFGTNSVFFFFHVVFECVKVAVANRWKCATFAAGLLSASLAVLLAIRSERNDDDAGGRDKSTENAVLDVWLPLFWGGLAGLALLWPAVRRARLVAAEAVDYGAGDEDSEDEDEDDDDGSGDDESGGGEDGVGSTKAKEEGTVDRIPLVLQRSRAFGDFYAAGVAPLVVSGVWLDLTPPPTTAPARN